MTISLKQLRYICAVARHRHFGKAADACCVTQSTLSAGVHELESQLDTRLFERGHKQVLITAMGREIVRRAGIVLRESEDLIAYARHRREPLTSVLHLGVIPTIAPFLLPGLLSHIRGNFPKLDIYLREDLSANLLQRLYQGELDLILWALPYPASETSERPLFEDPFLAVCPPGHPLADRPHLSQKDLRGQELLLLEEGHCLRDHALEACHLRNHQFSQSYQATSLHTLVQMVANGIGITLLPQMAVQAGILGDSGLAALPFDQEAVARTIGLAWRQTDPRADEYQLLGDSIRSYRIQGIAQRLAHPKST